MERRDRKRKKASAQNDAGRPVALDLIQWGGTGQDNGKYFEFADAARNELRVLRTEVENDDGLFFHEQFSLIRGVCKGKRCKGKSERRGVLNGQSRGSHDYWGPAASTRAAAKRKVRRHSGHIEEVSHDQVRQEDHHQEDKIILRRGARHA